MSGEFYIISISAAFGVLFFLLPLVLSTYFKFRGTRVITCPETERSAAVDIDVKHAVATVAFGHTTLRLKSCTRWPERQDCGQHCLSQIELAPEECLFQNLLAKWYEGKACAFCGMQFGEIHWTDRKPALLSPENKIVDWNEIRPETLPDVLPMHVAVCWNCFVVERFRREHPDLVFERPLREIAKK
jgi:hypothetical protein